MSHWCHGLPDHDDVIKWKHFPRYWPFVWGIHRSPVNSPHKGQWRGALMFSLIYVWINGWENNPEAGDFRCYRAHYDVIVMSPITLTHLPLDKMAAISQMIFSDAFSWMKSFVFWLKFHRSVFLRVQLTLSQHWFKIMAWRQIGTKPLSKPMLIWFTETSMQQ